MGKGEGGRGEGSRALILTWMGTYSAVLGPQAGAVAIYMEGACGRGRFGWNLVKKSGAEKVRSQRLRQRGRADDGGGQVGVSR